jgi:hypothetical protein
LPPDNWFCSSPVKKNLEALRYRLGQEISQKRNCSFSRPQETSPHTTINGKKVISTAVLKQGVALSTRYGF